VPNISASLSDEAYAIFRDYPGKKSPWINDLILEGDDLFRKWKALDHRCGYLQGIIAELMMDLFISRQGLEDDSLTQERVLRWNQALDSLDGTIHFHRFKFQELK
jgi:hypothetical protein